MLGFSRKGCEADLRATLDVGQQRSVLPNGSHGAQGLCETVGWEMAVCGGLPPGNFFQRG
jgi:hypothetical protein